MRGRDVEQWEETGLPPMRPCLLQGMRLLHCKEAAQMRQLLYEVHLTPPLPRLPPL
jgi:hypothetical protein